MVINMDKTLREIAESQHRSMSNLIELAEVNPGKK
jgi:hypothetical protein